MLQQLAVDQISDNNKIPEHLQSLLSKRVTKHVQLKQITCGFVPSKMKLNSKKIVCDIERDVYLFPLNCTQII